MLSGFTPAVSGEYVLELVVSDGIVSSVASQVSVYAISFEDALSLSMADITAAINSLDKSDFKNKNMCKTLTNKINATLKIIDDENYAEAAAKLADDILDKMDGCSEQGSADKNDMIISCEGQNLVVPLVESAISYLNSLQ